MRVTRTLTWLALLQFLLVGLGLAAGFWLLYYQAKPIQKHIEEDIQPTLRRLDNAQAQIQLLVLQAERGGFAAPAADSLLFTTGDWAGLNTNWINMRENLLGAPWLQQENSQRMQELESSLDILQNLPQTYRQQWDVVLAQRELNEGRRAKQLRQQAVDSLRNQYWGTAQANLLEVRDQLDGLQQNTYDRLDQQQAQLRQYTQTARWGGVGLLAVLLVLTLVTIATAKRGLNKPLQSLAQKAKNRKRLVVGSNSPLGPLAYEFNNLLTENQLTAQALGNLNKGRLNLEVTPDQLGDRLFVPLAGIGRKLVAQDDEKRKRELELREANKRAMAAERKINEQQKAQQQEIRLLDRGAARAYFNPEGLLLEGNDALLALLDLTNSDLAIEPHRLRPSTGQDMGWDELEEKLGQNTWWKGVLQVRTSADKTIRVLAVAAPEEDFNQLWMLELNDPAATSAPAPHRTAEQATQQDAQQELERLRQQHKTLQEQLEQEQSELRSVRQQLEVRSSNSSADPGRAASPKQEADQLPESVQQDFALLQRTLEQAPVDWSAWPQFAEHLTQDLGLHLQAEVQLWLVRPEQAAARRLGWSLGAGSVSFYEVQGETLQPLVFALEQSRSAPPSAFALGQAAWEAGLAGSATGPVAAYRASQDSQSVILLTLTRSNGAPAFTAREENLLNTLVLLLHQLAVSTQSPAGLLGSPAPQPAQNLAKLEAQLSALPEQLFQSFRMLAERNIQPGDTYLPPLLMKLDPQGQTLECSGSLELRTAQSREQLLGRPLTETLVVDDPAWSDLMNNLQEGRPWTGLLQTTPALQHLLGERLEATFLPLLGADNAPRESWLLLHTPESPAQPQGPTDSPGPAPSGAPKNSPVPTATPTLETGPTGSVQADNPRGANADQPLPKGLSPVQASSLQQAPIARPKLVGKALILEQKTSPKAASGGPAVSASRTQGALSSLEQAQLDALHNAMSVLDFQGDGQVSQVNAQFLKLLGLNTPADAKGRYWSYWAAKKQDPLNWMAAEQHVSKGDPYAGILPFRRVDGAIRWCQVFAQPQLDELGEARGGVLLMTDITQAKEQELRMKAQQASLQDLHQRPEIRNGELEPSLELILERARDMLGVARGSVWLWQEAEQAYRCVKALSTMQHEYSEGFQLQPERFPSYFNALEKQYTLAVEDAHNDPRTLELSLNVFKPAGTQSILDSTVLVSGRMRGILSFEYTEGLRQWRLDEVRYVEALANLIAQVLEIQQQARSSELEQALKKLEEANEFMAEQQHELEKRTFDIRESIRYAKRIQNNILPHKDYLSENLKNYFVMYRPRDGVGGDFYWFGVVNEQHVLVVADGTGHGVPGAFLTLIGYLLLNQIVLEKRITSPAEILNNLHQGVRTALKQDEEDSRSRDGMDVSVLSYDPHSLRGHWAGANLPFYYYQDWEVHVIKPDKKSIGGEQMEEERRFTNHDVQLQPGNSFYMFTDGLIDQFGGPNNKRFSTRRLRDLIMRTQHESMPTQRALVNLEWKEWKGDDEQLDDVTLIGVKV